MLDMRMSEVEGFIVLLLIVVIGLALLGCFIFFWRVHNGKI